MKNRLQIKDRTPGTYTIDPDGVPIDLLLDKWEPGMSFFVPCFDQVEAKRQIQLASRAAGAKRTVFEDRVEGGLAGLRCWRWR